MKKRNWLRTTIAMLTLVATVLETGFTSVSTLAAEITTEDGIVVNNDAVEETNLDATSGEDLQIEVAPDNGSDDEYVDGTDSEDADYEEEETFEEADELKDGSLDLSDSGITGSGYDEISVYVNTEGLKKKDTFRIEFNGPSSASYNPVLNDELDKTNDGRYDFEELEGGDFSVRAFSSDDVILSYRYNEDGYPEIVVESEETEKVLTTTTLTAKDDTEIEAISGEGFESIKVKFNTEELSDKTSFKLYVESDADATVNGKDAKAGIEGLGKDTDSLTIEDLEEESFVAYVVSDNDDVKIKTVAKVDSVEDGVAVITVDNENVKRVYEYGDSKIKVTATLEKADAVPDDAYFDVTALTEEEAEKYLEALNEGKDAENGDILATAENTLLYNIGFYTDGSKSEEIEPEEGSVSIAIEFKKDQLTEEIEAEEDEEIVVTHIMEDGSKVTTEEIDPQVSVENGTIDFSLDSFSVVAITKVGNRILKAGESLSYREVLKGAVNYGIVANKVELGGHIDSNFATGELKASCDTTQGKFTGEKIPGNTIVAKYNTEKGSGWYPYSSDGSSPFTVLTTTTAEPIFRANSNWRSYVTIDTAHTESGLADTVSALVSGTLSESLKTAQTRNKIKDAVNNNKIIDITSAGAGTYVLDFEPEDAGKYFDAADSTKIRLNSNQLIIFNIPGTSINLKKFAIEMVDKGLSDHSDTSNENADIYCQHVVFNMPDAKKVNLDGVFGTFLAPNAEVTIGTTSTGWLVADKFINGGEWHCVWQEMPREGEVKLNIPVSKKFINGTGRWGDGFNFKLEKLNDAGSAVDGNFTAQIINVNGTSEDATGYFELPVVKESQISWTNNGEWSYAGYSKYRGEWYRISEVDVNGKEINSRGATRRSDIEYNIIDPAKAYGENQNKQWEQPVYNNTKFWYVHVFYYLNPGTHDIITVKRTARVNPTTNCYKGLPCEEDGAVLFKNKYKPQVVTVQFEGIKKVTKGSTLTTDIPSGEFGFTLYKYTGGNKFEEVVQADVANEGSSVTFNPITLEPGKGWDDHNVYYFLIKETRCNKPYTKDESLFVAKVKLFMNNNVLDKTVQYYKYDPKDEASLVPAARDELQKFKFDATKFEFNNTYDASGETDFYGKKTLVGRKITKNDQFTFKLSSTDDDQEKASQEKTFSGPEVASKDFTFKFDTLSYDANDIGKTYHYVIEETHVNNAKISVSNVTQSVTVTITDDDKDGELEIDQHEFATITNPAPFTNVYDAESNIVFMAEKEYPEETALSKDKVFEFILSEVDENGTVISSMKKSVKGPGTVTFLEDQKTSTFEYKLEDLPENPDGSHGSRTYYYTINEVIPTGASTVDGQPTKRIHEGIIYDARVYKVKVVVSDKGDGTLDKALYGAYDIMPADSNKIESVDPSFVNDYAVPKPVGEPIVGKKTLSGGNVLQRKTFEFILEAGDTKTQTAIDNGEVVLPSKTKVFNGDPESLAASEFRFDDITFNVADTYKFRITEDIPEDTGNIAYSKAEYFVTITVTDNGKGNLAIKKPENKVITKTGTEGVVNEIGFVNTPYSPGEVPLYAHKDLTGRAIEENQFTFQLKQGETVLQEAKNDASGDVTFENLHYEFSQLGGQKSKDFEYTIVEVIPEGAVKQDDGTYKLNGYTYDGHTENVKVTVEDNGDGTLKVTAFNATIDKKAKFKNKYEAEGEIDIDGTKRITGREFEDDDYGKFYAELYEGNKRIDRVAVSKSTSIFGGDGGLFDFKTIHYTEKDLNNLKTVKKTYTVKETDETVPGITNDTTVYTVTVTLTDNGKGHIEAVKDREPEDVCFNNIYAGEGSTHFLARKKVNDEYNGNELFTFELYAKDEDGNFTKKIDSKKNTDGGWIVFKELEYDQEDLAKSPIEYQIKEKVQNIAGYTLSDAVYTAKAFLSIDKTTGNISVQKKYYDSNNVQVAEGENWVEFDNTYDAKGKVVLEAKKTLIGKDITEANKFKFDLYDQSGKYVSSASVVSAKAGKPATAKFPEIVYTKDDMVNAIGEDKYAVYYTMKEYIPDGAAGPFKDGTYKKDGYTYDGTVYNIVVTLEDLGNGKIDTDWYAYKTGETPKDVGFWDRILGFITGNGVGKDTGFTNYYDTEGAIDISAKKILTGKTLEAGKYSFTLTGTDENVKVNQTKSNAADGTVKFDRITYTKDGTYTYTVKEVIPPGAEEKDGFMVLDGVRYDTNEYTVTVVVSDAAGNGKLDVKAYLGSAEGTLYATSAEIQEGDKTISLCTPAAFEFTNVYVPTDITIIPGGTKTLSGRPIQDNEFLFTIKSKDGNPKKLEQTVKNSGQTFSFDPITFTAKDMLDTVTGLYVDSRTFEYTVTEERGNLPGVTYDTTSYDVVVTVTNDKGVLNASITSNGGTVSADKIASFLNPYNAEGNEKFFVKKLIKGTDDNTKKFLFILTDENNKKYTKEVSAADGAVEIASFDYKLEDLIDHADGKYRDYKYTVKEFEPDEKGGYEYSKDVYDAVVTVKDNGSGTLVTEKKITLKGKPYTGTAMEFTNEYSAKGDIEIPGIKELTGGRKLSEEDFTFILEEPVVGTDGNTTYKKVDETSNDKTSGKFGFKLDFTEADIKNSPFIYRVREVIPEDQKDIDYDTTVYDVKVYVADVKHNGELTVTKEITKDGEPVEECSFTNKVVTPDSVQFVAEKTLDGMPIATDMFTFILEGTNNNEKQIVKNNGTAVTFKPISYELKDAGKTFSYKVTEKAESSITGMKYSEVVYTADVKVTNNKGTLETETKLYKDGTAVTTTKEGVITDLKFENKYRSVTTVDIGGHKVLKGFKDGITPLGTYSFELLDKNGQRVRVDKNIKIDDEKTNIVRTGGTEQAVEVTPKNATDPTDYKFDTLIFDQDDYYNSAATNHIFEYTVKEVVPVQKQENVEYAKNEYHVTVELYIDNNGKLQARKSTSEGVGLEDLDFTNKYAAEGDVTLDGFKTIKGKELVNAAYTFKLTTISGKNAEQEVTNNGSQFTFDAISYDQSDIGTHVYQIEETASKDGSKIDSAVFTATVTVGPGKDGKLDIKREYSRDKDGTVTYPDTISFENTYEAKGEIDIEGIKVMHNKPLAAGDFQFVLKDENGKELQKVTHAAAPLNNKKDLEARAAFAFEPLKFTQEDLKSVDGSYLPEITKYYTVEEIVASKGGVVYSKAAYVVEVVIKSDGTDKLDVTKSVVGKNVVVKEDNGIAKFLSSLIGKTKGRNDEIIFENEYDSECTIDPPILRKQIMGKKIERGDFEFVIEGPGLRSMGEDEKGYRRTVKNGYAPDGSIYYPDGEEIPAGEIYVGDIKYKYIDLIDLKKDDPNEFTLNEGAKKRTFVYTATEVAKDSDGVGYSPQKFQLVVNVEENNDGTLTVRNENGIVVNNDKNDKEHKLFWKALTDYRLSDEQMKDTFLNTFNQTGSINLIGTKKMSGRKLTAEDKFEFILTDDKTGASVTVNNTMLNGTPSVIAFKGQKDKNDGPEVVVANFLNYRYGAFEEKPGQTPVNLIEVDDTGEHTYTIVEKFYEGNGIKCDTSSFRVHVDVQPVVDGNGKPVVDAQGHGQLSVQVTKVDHLFTDNNVGDFEFAPGNYFEFVNTFKAEGKIDFPGKKYLKDQAGNDIVSPDALEDEYEFALYSYSDAARKHDKTLVDVVKTDKDGNFKLDVPKYTEEVMKNEKGEYVDTKTLYYRLIETKPANGTWTENNTLFESDGVIYDNTEYDIDVNIAFERDAQGYLTGKLLPVAEIKKADTGEAIKNISFTNIVKEYVSVEGEKHWIDKETDPSKRPDVLLRLYSSAVDNGRTEINRYTIKAPDTTYRFFTDAQGNKLPATDSKGRAITYTVTEDVIRGYLSEQVGYDFYNTQGDILIRKIDADTGRPLSGAVLAILDGSTEVERWTSGASAHVVEKALTPGKTYTLHEVSAPEGYEVAADVTFTVPTDGSSITVTMADPPIIGSVRLIKRDEATRAELAGAEFALFTESGARIYATGTAGSYRATSSTSNGVFVTDAAGALTIADLPYGTYYFVETKAPEGYALSTERLGFTILRGGELVEVTFMDPKAEGSVRLRKVGASGRALSGAVFELYAATPRTIGQAASSTIFSDAYYRYGTYRTNAAGELYVGELPWDDYYFIEVEAPEGYEIATDVNGDQLVYTFSVSAASADATIDLGGIVNTPTTPPPTPTPTPGVLGARVKRGGVVNGVLGVRAKPTSGVLGERIGPVTGDASNIILWLLLFTACVATIVATIVTGKKKKTAR